MKSRLKFATMLAVSTIALSTAAAATAGTNLIVNGGFETGDFTGWITNPSGYPEYIVTYPVESGFYAAQIAGYSYNVDTLSQAVTTTPGRSYTLSFGYWQDPATPNGINVTWDGNSVYSTTDTNTGLAFWNITTTVVGQGSDMLVFTAYNDPAFTYLDDVSLTSSVPEPGAWSLLLLGLGGLGLALRARRQARGAAAAA